MVDFYLAHQIHVRHKEEFKALNEPKLGVTVKMSAAKIGGVFREDWLRINIGVSDHVVGRTCSEIQHMEHARKTLELINQHQPLFKKQ